MTIKIISDELLNSYSTARNYSAAQRRMFEKTTDTIYQTLTAGKTSRPPGAIGELVNVVGIPGAGKTTLLRQSLMTDKRQRHSIVFDPDIIREQMPFFQNTIATHQRRGLDIWQADWKAFYQWSPATIVITQSLVNRAQADGYDIVRCGTMGGPVTNDICARANLAGFEIVTPIVLAPLDVCCESVEQRVKAGGHPVQHDYIASAFDEIVPAISRLVAASRETHFFWRGESAGNANLAAIIDGQRRCSTHHSAAALSISETFGRPIESFDLRNSANRALLSSGKRDGWTL
jgi:predicted ABC-type ATPase